MTSSVSQAYRHWHRIASQYPVLPLGLLLATQVLTIIGSPTLSRDWPVAGTIFSVMIITNLTLALAPLSLNRPGIRLALEISGVCMIILAIVTPYRQTANWQTYTEISFSLIFFLCVMLLLLFQLFTETGQREKLLAAINFFLLTGITFSYLYMLINLVSPGAFDFHGENIVNWPDFLYFSFVTLTTLGYGDILPVSSLAQSLASLESVIGVLSPTVMIARFVSTS